MEIHLASPRGFCAGVERAIEIVERALSRFGPPIYVRHEIVHNAHVVWDLERKGAVFVDDLARVPVGSWTVFSAHGVPPSVVEEAESRDLKVIDATCPLVTKVHIEARSLANRGYTILLVGHRDHVEVEGVVGEAEDHVLVIENREEAARVEVTDPSRVAVLTQTTLSVDEARRVTEVLLRRFPDLVLPRTDDICYATQNRQDAVKAKSSAVDLWLVIGDKTSSNSNRLRELGESQGVPAYLCLGADEIDPSWFDGVRSVGVTSGASTPEHSVQAVLARLAELGAVLVEDGSEPVEDMAFSLPEILRGTPR